MFLILICLIVNINTFIEGRVFCQDLFAAPWSAIALSCPLRCENVITAVDELQERDFKALVKQRNLQLKNFNHKKLVTVKVQDKEDKKIDAFVERHEREQEKFDKDSFRRDGKFVEDVKNGFNKTISSEKSSTRTNLVFIKKILGDKYYRTGHNDVEQILAYLQTAAKSGKRTVTVPTIRLVPKHCMSVRPPGCYCIKGYVEKSGQCVKPIDCILDERKKMYMKGIVIE